MVEWGLISGDMLLKAPVPLKIAGTNIYTTAPEAYREAGYKEIQYTNAPTDGEYVEKWIVQGDKIVQSWEKQPEDAADFEEAMAILAGEDESE